METKIQSNDDLYNAIQNGEISEKPQIKVYATINAPSGGYGFRRGRWSVIVDGIAFRMFDSIPHALTLDEQEAKLLEGVKRKIARAREGETYDDRGTERLRYTSQMRRIKTEELFTAV